MKYLSLFSGIGGFELGIQRAFNQQPAQIEQDGQGRNGATDEMEHDVLPTSRSTPFCIGYSEIDKYAIKVYERHFNGDNRPDLWNGAEKIQNNSSDIRGRKDRATSEHTNYGDATTINPAELPNFDLLVGGFPCQAFSIAGKRKGFDDTRGTLFFDIARILKEKRPRHLVLENVKGLLSHDSGKTFQTILGVLSDLGYRVEWQVLNSKDFGVPQNRERVFIIGHLRGECGRQVLPITGHNRQDIKQINKPVHSNDRIYDPKGISPTLNTMQGGLRQPFVAVQPVMTVNRFNKKQNGRQIKPAGEPSHTLTAQDRHGVLISKTVRAGGRGSPHGAKQNWDSYEVNGVIRRLTPLECERLQAFPDNWTAEGVDGPISDTQRYKMCGNAVTVNVVEAVIKGLLPCLN